MRTYHLFIVACLGLINVACSSGTPPGSGVIATTYVTAIEKIYAMSASRSTVSLTTTSELGFSANWSAEALVTPSLKNVNNKTPSAADLS